MAQSYTTTDGVLIIPGAYSTFKVEQSNSGLATTGVIMLVGEAEAGQDFSTEEELYLNSFGPDQASDVVAKYKSGPLVDAFKGAIAAANDPNIVGSFSRIILAKTNVSAQASGNNLKNYDASNYADSTTAAVKPKDKNFGKSGNLIGLTVTANTAEAAVTTGAILIAKAQVNTDVLFRVNGGAELSISLTASDLPPAIVADIDGLAGIDATGGAAVVLAASIAAKSLALTLVTGNKVRIDLTGGTWDNTPVVGSQAYLPAGGIISGGADENAGTYVITAANTTQIFATKLIDATGAGATLTAPLSDVGGSIVTSMATHLNVFGQIYVTLTASNPSPGLGKSLEIANKATGGLASNIVFSTAGLANPVVSTVAAPKALTAGTEYSTAFTLTRASDNVNETITAGGTIILTLGYAGTTGSITLDKVLGTASITVAGGSNPGTYTLSLSDYASIADLCSYINSLSPSFTAAPASGLTATVNPKVLDSGVFGIATSQGAKVGRIKADANKLYNAINNTSVLVNLTAEGISGLPAPAALSFLSGGSKGGTTTAQVTAAIDALEAVQGNFLIPLFSRDASLDIADGLTDASSTYSIASINAYARTHVLKLSTLKRRRNRQAFCSVEDTFNNAKSAASNLASFRVAMTFQDIKDSDSFGVIKQYQPWLGAVKAAAMQAAGFYRPIVHKFINISGVLQKAGDFKDQNDTNVEDALLAGLLPIRRSDTGGFFWVSDQTTYGKDNNFVYNSIQATYVADIIAMTTAKRMELAFVGQSVADVNAQFALMTLETIMADFFRLRLIAASDDAVRGFKNATIKIKGPTMVVSIEVKLAGAIYFIPISFLVSQVEQSAG